MTEQEFQRMLKTSAPGVQVKTETILPVKRKISTRGNIKTEVDGIIFDSKKESERYKHLKILLAGNAISDLRMQVGYELNPNGNYSFIYYADFVYTMDGERIIEDVKGYDLVKGEFILSPTFKKKKKLMKKLYNIEVRIVK